MTEYTPDKIAEDVLRLDQAATPGPWERCGEARGGCVCTFVWAVKEEVLISTCRVEDLPPPPEEQARANAELIAAYRIDAPILAREVNHLRQELCRTERERQELFARLCEAQAQLARLQP